MSFAPAQRAIARVSLAQRRMLLTYCNEAGVKRGELLERFRIPHVGELFAYRFDEARDWIFEQRNARQQKQKE